MTTIIVPGHWLHGSDVDVNAWLEARGATVVRRVKTRIRWRITIAETLTLAQQSALAAKIERVFNRVRFE